MAVKHDLAAEYVSASLQHSCTFLTRDGCNFMGYTLISVCFFKKSLQLAEQETQQETPLS